MKTCARRRPTVASASFLIIALGMAVSKTTLAQAPQEQAARDTPPVSGVVLEEVTVSAQKRTENLQKVPIAISSLSSEALEARAISNVEDLQYSIPGLKVGENTVGTARITIRGVGNQNNAPGGDPAVAMHIDGHYVQSPAYMLRTFLDVERVEVLRGPQGTLYGRNATGGSINIIGKRPTEEFSTEFSAELGSYDKHLVQGAISGPLVGRLRGRLSVADGSRDGYVDNAFTGEDVIDSDLFSARAALSYDISDAADIYLTGFHYEDEGTQVVFRVPQPPNTVTLGDIRKINANDPLDGNDEAKGGSLDFTWNLGGVTFRSLSAYSDSDTVLLLDVDSGSPASVPLYHTQGSRVFTEELQLLSATDGPLKWILGLFYFDEDGYRGGGSRTTMVTTDNQVDSVSRAVFGQVDYRFTERLELSAGLRYTRDEKDTSLLNPFTGVFAGEVSDEWSKVTGKVGVNFYVHDGLMLYALYSTGYNAGGYNQLLSYDPEEVAAYELGMKSRWLQDRLQLNVSTFYNDYTDKQEQLLGPDGQGGFVRTFRNAAAASIPGVELELQARPNEVLSLDASIAYQKARYDAYTTDDPSNPALGVQELEGNQLLDSPDLTVNLGVQGEWPLGANSGVIQVRIDYSWVDERYFRAFNLPSDRVDAYHRTNATLKWESPSHAWNAQLYVKNIEDDDVVANYILAGTRGIKFYHDPRTYGIKLGYRF